MSRYLQIDTATGNVIRQLDVPAEELSFYEAPGRTFIPWDTALPTVGTSRIVTVDGQHQLVTTLPEPTIHDIRDKRNQRLQGVIARLDADVKRQELGLSTVMTPAKRAEWLAYYQALCDVPQNFVPGVEMVWPTPPSE